MTDAHKRIEPEPYAPFPEAELRDIMLHSLPAVTPILRNALLSFAALRERMLLGETENAQLKRALTLAERKET